MMAAAGEADAIVVFQPALGSGGRRGLRRLGLERAEPSGAPRHADTRLVRRASAPATSAPAAWCSTTPGPAARAWPLHTFFQLPLTEYPASEGSRTQRALHALLFHPEDGLVAGMLSLESEGVLHRRDGELRFLDLVPRHG